MNCDWTQYSSKILSDGLVGRIFFLRNFLEYTLITLGICFVNNNEIAVIASDRLVALYFRRGAAQRAVRVLLNYI